MFDALYERINQRSVVVGILGLGYVGLPLALAFAEKIQVIGYDISQSKIDQILEGHSPIKDIDDMYLQQYLHRSFHPTNDIKLLQSCDVLIICVPTPLACDKQPDLSYIKSVSRTISPFLKKEMCVILESTTYPGTTEEVMVPILEQSGLRAGSDFVVAYSPERIDPGNKVFSVKNTPKVVGGLTDECTEVSLRVYQIAVPNVIRVRDCRTAEAVKMLENIYRNVNIALVNEMALIFERMRIDVWEVIAAASSKPYGYMPFYPGPGIGGHCIPLDPFYMSYQAKRYGIIPRFIETSGEINDFMVVHTINLIESGLSKVNKCLFGAKITVLGLAYKKNVDDTRESPSIRIIEELVNLGADVRVYDPFVLDVNTRAGTFHSESTMDSALSGADCAVFLVDHDQFRAIDLETAATRMSTGVVVDCKNIFTGVKGIVYLGIGKRNDAEL